MAALAVAATAVALIVAVPATASAKLPPKPTPPAVVPAVSAGQVQAANNTAAADATKVGQLNGQVAAAQAALHRLQAAAELAEQKVAFTISDLRKKQQASTAADAALVAARASVAKAHTQFVQYLQATYMSGDINGTGGALLTASDPNELLDQSALESYEAEHHADAVGNLQQATVVSSNARATATLKKAQAQQALTAAQAAQHAADQQASEAKTKKAALDAQLADKQSELDQANLALATTTGGRAAYLAYLQHKTAYNQALGVWTTAYNAEQARKAAAAHRAFLQHQREVAAEKAREKQEHHGGGGGAGSGGGSTSGGGGGGGSSSGGGGGGPSAPSGGTWTATKGKAAAARAKSELGVPYAWAGGGVGGPSYGVCDAGNGAPFDCEVDGFDCSGLAMYAWGQDWDHYAATQYRQAGSYHPSPGKFKPGDLLFWSSDGTRSGIEHVAIYVGGGNVVQAPESGDVVKTTPWNQVMWGYYGATRPLT